MNTIKKKMFFQLGTLVVLLIGIILIANNVFLEDYYIDKKLELIEEYYYEINSIESDDYEESANYFASIESTSNLDIVINSIDDEIIYSSRIYFGEPGTSKPPVIGPNGIENENDESYIVNDDFMIVRTKDVQLNNELLLLHGELDNGYRIQLSIPIASIQENIRYTNSFLLYIGALWLVISLILAYFISNKFTKPILQINNITKKMKELDFTNLISVKSNDEIGELSSSINDLAIALNHTINDLKNEAQANKELSNKRRELLNNVSHELKTPLSLIQGYSEGLISNLNTSKEKNDFYCNVIIDESKNMNRIIEDLLEINIHETMGSVSEIKEVELSQFLKEVTSKYERRFDEKQIIFEEVYVNDTIVDIDVYLTNRVITNYIVNAINYCPNKSKIIVSYENIDKFTRISVFNTHKGIDAENLENVWDTFYKVDESRQRDIGGHGLGLSIVKTIQEKQGLAYGVKNVDGGILFWFDVLTHV